MVFEREVRVSRNRLPQSALDATRLGQNIDRAVVKAIPRGRVGWVDVYRFQGLQVLSNDQLMMEYDRHGAEPSPMAQISLNRADRSFAGKYLNVSHFKDADGNWCYVSFSGRVVIVQRSGMYYNAGLWFIGILK
jgi:hypothetical protein